MDSEFALSPFREKRGPAKSLTTQFIRYLNIPYCVLYDQGYTSLGGTEDTHPNPKLRVRNNTGKEKEAEFRPAYELNGDEEERLGRE